MLCEPCNPSNPGDDDGLCTFVIARKQRRCRLPREAGSDVCAKHTADALHELRALESARRDAAQPTDAPPWPRTPLAPPSDAVLARTCALLGAGLDVHVDLESGADCEYVREASERDANRGWLGLSAEWPADDAEQQGAAGGVGSDGGVEGGQVRGGWSCLRVDAHDLRVVALVLESLVRRGHRLCSASIRFPRAWPKEKQAHRRLVTAPLLSCLHEWMTPGGVLLIVTDSPQAAFNAAAVFEEQAHLFRQTHRPADALTPPLCTRERQPAVRVLRFIAEHADLPPPRVESRRTIDYLLAGESVRANRHLARFAASAYLPTLLAEPRCDGLWRRASKSLRKERTSRGLGRVV